VWTGVLGGKGGGAESDETRFETRFGSGGASFLSIEDRRCRARAAAVATAHSIATFHFSSSARFGALSSNAPSLGLPVSASTSKDMTK
jgi:hypothetical protein